MRAWLVLALLGAACASDPKRNAAPVADTEPPIGPTTLPASTASSPATASSSTVSSNAGASSSDGACIVVSAESAGSPASVEGVLRAEPGKQKGGMFLLRLARPRCIVGLPRSSFVTEVYVSTTGPDLRPFLDTRIRVSGDVLGGTNDLGGSAVMMLAKDIARLEPSPTEP